MGQGRLGVGAVGRVALKHVHWSGTGTFGVGGRGEDGVKTRTLEWTGTFGVGAVGRMALKHVHWSGTGTFGVEAVGRMALKHVHWSGTGTFGVEAVGRMALKHVHWSGTGTFGVGAVTSPVARSSREGKCLISCRVTGPPLVSYPRGRLLASGEARRPGVERTRAKKAALGGSALQTETNRPQTTLFFSSPSTIPSASLMIHKMKKAPLF